MGNLKIEELKARLKKIKALADSGIGGEKDAAYAILEKAMKQYGISIDELEDDAILKFPLRKRNLCKWERVLWGQLIALAALGKPEYDVKGLYVNRISRRTYVKCTRAEFVEASAAFAVLSRDYRRQISRFLMAFMIKNNLLLPAGRGSDCPPSKKEIEEQLEAMQLAEGIQKTNRHVQIENREV